MKLTTESQHQLFFLYKNENDLSNLSLYIFSMIVEPGVNTVAIESAVKEHVNGAQVARQHGKELVFLLPSSESDKYGCKISILIRAHVMKLVYSLSVAGIYFCLNVFRATFQYDLTNSSMVFRNSCR